eukprot:UC1_evm1s2010
MATDTKSTSRLLVHVVDMCFEAGAWDTMGEYVILLTKRRGQLKQAMTKMVQRACEVLEQAPDKETTLRTIDTLRTVTEGKIHVEVERARLTMKLAMMKEADGNTIGAADTLQDLQVETFGSMEKREKVEFILEQMRLGLKKKDFIRTQIISKKISTRFFADESASDLKLKYYRLMLDLSQHDKDYLSMCKYTRAMFDTPSVQADKETWLPLLRDAVIYLALAPHDNESSDLVARVNEEKRLSELPEARAALQVFVTAEVTPWRIFEETYGSYLRATPILDSSSESGKSNWDELRLRIVEHNIRVMSKYYERISIGRMAQLLDLDESDAESHLARLVSSKTVYAKVDRPARIVSFREEANPNTVLNEWSTNLSSLMTLVDKAAHLISKERMVHKV